MEDYPRRKASTCKGRCLGSLLWLTGRCADARYNQLWYKSKFSQRLQHVRSCCIQAWRRESWYCICWVRLFPFIRKRSLTQSFTCRETPVTFNECIRFQSYYSASYTGTSILAWARSGMSMVSSLVSVKRMLMGT